MPLYFYRCQNCGCEQEQFLNADKQSLPIKCKRCFRQTIAHQVKDKNMQYKKNGDVVGIFREYEKTKTTIQKARGRQNSP